MIKKVMLSLWIWSTGIILTVALYFVMLIAIAITPFDKKRKLAHAQCYWWANAIIALNPFWKVSVSGLENIDNKKTYVIVANHRSLADIILIYKIKMQFKWVAKESLYSIPFLGWCMSLCKHIRLERGDLSSIKHLYKEAAIWLRSGMSVLFFPEGTRSENGQMKEFQNGAFKLAIREKLPILPISIKGTGEAIPKGSKLFTAHIPAKIKVLPAIETSDTGIANFENLRDSIRQMLIDAER